MGPPGEDGSGESVSAECSPWWPLVRGSSRGRTVHSGGGRRVAPSDESRLIHLILLVKTNGAVLLRGLKGHYAHGVNNCFSREFSFVF